MASKANKSASSVMWEKLGTLGKLAEKITTFPISQKFWERVPFKHQWVTCHFPDFPPADARADIRT
jgi:hypothetical protein